MTSFAGRIEPESQVRLAAAALLLHGLAAAAPWVANCPPVMATALSLLAGAGLAGSLASVPGPHGLLRCLEFGHFGWRAWIATSGEAFSATLGDRCRVFPGLVCVDLMVDGCRQAWLLPRTAVPSAEFRRLKARVRLAC